MSQVIQLKLPMRMTVNNKGEVESLNLNVYRNLHFRKLSYQKNAFHRKMNPLLLGLPKLGKVSLHYEIHPKSGGRLDTMNVGSIVDKYFSDALVEAGVILDDDYTNVVFNSFKFGSVCPNDAHVLVTITETEPRRTETMRILLDQNEIQQALETFVQTMGLPGVSGVELSVDADGSIMAEIVTGPLQPKATHTAYHETNSSGIVVRPKRGGRPLGSKNKPKEPEDDTMGTTGPSGSVSNGAGSPEPAEEEADIPKTDDDLGEEDHGSESQEQNGKPSPNLFGDSETESASNNPDPDEDEEETGDPVPVPEEQRVKKSSIFDE